MYDMCVYDLMRSPVITVLPWTRLPQIRALMFDRQIDRLPVVEGGVVVGMITMGDLRNAFPSDIGALSGYPSPQAIARTQAREIMRAPVITIAPEQSLVEAIRLMLAQRVGGLPVIDAGELVGIITRSDVCRALVEPDRALGLPALGRLQRTPAGRVSALSVGS